MEDAAVPKRLGEARAGSSPASVQVIGCCKGCAWPRWGCAVVAISKSALLGRPPPHHLPHHGLPLPRRSASAPWPYGQWTRYDSGNRNDQLTDVC